MSYIIAIDGPAGSGKGTIAEIVSKRLGITNIGSGLAYRSVALELINRGIKIEETQKIIDCLDEINIEIKIENGTSVIFLNNNNVTDKLTQKDVTEIVSPVSSIKEVRYKLNDIFRECAKSTDVIMEGRDIGTFVFPDADIKIYLDATQEKRAQRRYEQYQESGIKMSYEDILENIKARDKNDIQKEIGALKKADDAIYIDSTNMSIEEVVEKIINIVKEKRR